MLSGCHRTAHINIQIQMPEEAVSDALLILQSYACSEYRIEECRTARGESMRGPSRHTKLQSSCVIASAKCYPAYLSTLVEELEARFGTSITICTEAYSHNASE